MKQWLGIPCNAEDLGSAFRPGSERSPGNRNGYPLQYSCLENSVGRGASRAIVLGSCDLDQQSVVHIVLRPRRRGPEGHTPRGDRPRPAWGRSDREPQSLTRVDLSGSLLPADSVGLAVILRDREESGASSAPGPGSRWRRGHGVHCTGPKMYLFISLPHRVSEDISCPGLFGIRFPNISDRKSFFPPFSFLS
ncbi:hypothetical protein FD755_008916 [Muntiacus reevesi]|uniref:Uncharacterized protein n=1 Tax=Muntiacus reevesi TaxID=9886 RepID=A0A5J5MNC6_MUNRE|nr:hypothetical protein FD755_008916 [Muntiacus reevesi]